MTLFETLENRLIIKTTLEMQTALSIGGQLSLEPTGTDLPVVKTPDGEPFMPGSSIKGMLRFQSERLLRSLNRRPDFWACDPFDDPCISNEKKNEISLNIEQKRTKQQEKEFSQQIWDQSCTACRLFGSPWYRSRLSFKDAYLNNGQELLVATQIRDGVAIDRDLGTARTRAKYDFEVVVPGVYFGLEILADNLDDWETGFLLAVLRMWQEGNLAIGGKTTRGPGWGKLGELEFEQVDKANLLEYLTKGSTRSVDADQFAQAFLEKISVNNGEQDHA
jgi:CRISPR-associated RAMP protein (TIGR02581 family)